MSSLESLALCLALSSMGQAPGVGETVLIEFTADWCGPCQTMQPMLHQLKAAGYPIRQVNVDRNRALAAQYRVTNIPCFVMVAGGREIERQTGATDQARLLGMLQRAGVQAAGRENARALGQSPDGSRSKGIPFFSRETPARSTDSRAVEITSLGVQPALAPRPSVATSPQPYSRTQSQNPPPITNPTELEQRLVRATVRLKVDDPSGHSFGTGTMIDRRGNDVLVLTCGHLFRDFDGTGAILVEFTSQGRQVQAPGRLLSHDLKRDLGLVSIRTLEPVQLARVASGNTPAAIGDRVVNVGCNNGQAPTPRRSRITGIDKYLGPPNLEVAGMPVEGRSGGGVFDQRGNLIGVCFAADPADNEGVYAGLASIHAELDRMGLQAVYRGGNQTSHPATSLASVEPPAMPEQMPVASQQSLPATTGPLITPTATAAMPPGDRPAVANSLSAAEQATLAELGKRVQEAEVICIVRPLNDSQAKSEIIVLDRASPEFLRQLSARRRMDRRQLTSYEREHVQRPQR